MKLFRSGGEYILPGLTSFFGEEDQSWVVVGEDWLNVVLTEGDEDGDRGGFSPVDDSCRGALTRVLEWGVVESAGESDTRPTEAKLLSASSIVRVIELVFL